MLRACSPPSIGIVVFTVVLGFGYPALMTGVAQLAMSAPGEREPDRARRDRSSAPSLAAQDFSFAGYFHERPSATSPAYNPELHDLLQPRPDESRRSRSSSRQNAEAILKLEGPYNPG